MITFRGLPTAIALVVLSAISLAAAWRVMRHELDGSQLGDPQGILTWLAHNDVRQHPLETQSRVVRRLEMHLGSSGDLQAELDLLPADERERLRQNAQALTGVWLRQKVDAYFARPEDERNDYLDREIATMLKWPALLQQDSDGPSDGPGADMLGLVDQLAAMAPLMEQLIRQADPAEQRRIQEFAVAVQSRAAVQRIFGGGRRRLDQSD